MSMPDPDEHARALAADALSEGDPVGWFERLYAAADTGAATVPWDAPEPHFLLPEWAEAGGIDGTGRDAVVVGCGLGRDAEYLAGLGFRVTAFDVSESGVAAAKRRHPDSSVRYVTADLFDVPGDWVAAYDLVLESLTVQSLPLSLRAEAIGAVTRLVAPGGTLLVVAFGRDTEELPAGPPWPLSRAEIEAFGAGELRARRIEELRDAGPPEVLRWRAEFGRPL